MARALTGAQVAIEHTENGQNPIWARLKEKKIDPLPLHSLILLAPGPGFKTRLLLKDLGVPPAGHSTSWTPGRGVSSPLTGKNKLPPALHAEVEMRFFPVSSGGFCFRKLQNCQTWTFLADFEGSKKFSRWSRGKNFSLVRGPATLSTSQIWTALKSL